MKRCRVLPWMLFSLLTIASVEAAAAVQPASGAVEPSPSSTEDFFCGLKASAAVEIPGLTQAPRSANEVCGTCGPDLCDNRFVGAACYGAYNPTGGISGGWGWCIPPTTSTCSDERPRCDCLTEYP